MKALRMKTMRNVLTLLLLSAVVAVALGPQAGAVTVQPGEQAFGDRSFLWLEAESYSSLGDDPEGDGWKIVSKETPVTSTGGIDILPASSNVHGTALLDDIGGGQHTDTAVYQVQFATAGTYQFYSRHTMFDSNANGSFSNEDSIFVSPAFDKNSSTDWIGFQGLRFDDQDPDAAIPDTGYALDPIGFKPETGDTENEGWHAIRDWRIKSKGVLQGTSSQDPSLQNGVFSWYNRPAYVSSGAGGGFDSDFGFKTEFIVTPEQVGNVVTFEIGTREVYGVFDGFLFIQDDAVDLLDQYSQDEVTAEIFGIVDGGGDDPLAGDFDASGAVGNDDLTLLLDAWGGAPPAGWTKNAPVSVGNDSLTQLLDTWGNSALSGVSAVPEPSTLVMLGVRALLLSGRKRSSVA
jgi:hypothetical protein